MPDDIYLVRAYWPNSAMPPRETRWPDLASATIQAFSLRDSGEFMTITVLVEDIRLELIKLWGQPMPNGKAWP